MSFRVGAVRSFVYVSAMNLAAKFIVIDGPDGCGKTTQLGALKKHVEHLGGKWTYAKDPGGTPVGDRIRHLLLNYDLREMGPRCEALLFMASRAQLVDEVVQPALDRGETIIGDRYISATCAYQAAAGADPAWILKLGMLAVGDIWPDLTIVLDVPPELGFERTGRKPHHALQRNADAGQIALFDGAAADAMERRPLEFHRRVYENFLALPDVYPRPVEIIDGTRPAEQVTAALIEVLERVFP